MKRMMFQILSTFLLLALVAAGPVAARMTGSGGGNQGDMSGGTGSGMGSGSTEKGMTSRYQAHQDIGSMPGITTGGLGSGDMTMDIKPVRYKDGRLEVKYYGNTHSVSLGKYDLMELCTLEVDGKVYKPVKADRMRGHHSGGRIIFEVPEEPDRFRIVIRDIPRVNERTYDWN